MPFKKKKEDKRLEKRSIELCTKCKLKSVKRVIRPFSDVDILFFSAFFLTPPSTFFVKEVSKIFSHSLARDFKKCLGSFYFFFFLFLCLLFFSRSLTIVCVALFFANVKSIQWQTTENNENWFDDSSETVCWRFFNSNRQFKICKQTSTMYNYFDVLKCLIECRFVNSEVQSYDGEIKHVEDK